MNRNNNRNSNNKTRVSWCPNCAKVGINSPLKHRIYTNEDGSINANPPPPDSKNWRQCWTCGKVIAVYAAQQEADIGTLAEPTNNPFNYYSSDSNELAEEPVSAIQSQDRKFDRTCKTRRRKKFKQDLEQNKEEDVKQALRKGSKLISYTST
jgi:hypothetical protein